MHGQCRMRDRAQRVGEHFRSEIGTTDADIDDRANRHAGETKCLPGADLLREGSHTLACGQNLGHDVQISAGERRSRSPQGDVQHRSILADIDLLTAEHAGRRFGKPGFPGQFDQQGQGCRIHALFREVEEEPFEAE